MSIHLGQRKLLLIEVYYLINNSHLSKNIIYIGAAPGDHISYLSELFPQNAFYLFDPRPFSIKQTNKIIIKQELFSTKSIKYLNNDYLIISDIRSNINNKMTQHEIDLIITNDMRLQESWIKELNPKSALLKFSLPKDSQSMPTFTYLGGQLLNQPWAPLNTFESRLIWNHQEDYQYNIFDYKNFMDKNKFLRSSLITKHNISLKRTHGLDYCYDCNEEINIWKKYLNYHQKDFSNTDIINIINRTSIKTKKFLTKRPHGLIK